MAACAQRVGDNRIPRAHLPTSSVTWLALGQWTLLQRKGTLFLRMTPRVFSGHHTHVHKQERGGGGGERDGESAHKPLSHLLPAFTREGRQLSTAPGHSCLL